MNLRSRILYQFGFLTMNEKWLNTQKSRQNIDALHFALDKGLYDIRKLAAEHLGVLR